MNVILLKDHVFGSHLKKKGTIVKVTRDYGRELIREKIARDENFVEKIKVVLKTKRIK